MELHQIRYFLAVARTGNFSRAAEACYVSQPSLSQQILKLEDELGQALFYRQPQGSILTDAGRLFLPYARQIAGAVEESQLRVRESSGEVRGELHLGILPTIAPYLLPGLLEPFSRAYPGVEVIVQEEVTPQLVQSLLAGQLDLALLSTPLGQAALCEEPLLDEPLLLVLPEAHPLARRDEVRMSDLPQERFILMQEGHCLADQALEFCHTRAGFAPQVSCRSAQVATLLALVAAGMGISIVPAMAAEPRTGIVFRSFTPSAPTRRIGFASRADRYRLNAAKAFIEMAQSVVKLERVEDEASNRSSRL